MQLPEHKKQFLKAVNFQEDEIAAIEATMAQMASKAQADGIKSKDAEVVVTVSTTPAPVATTEPVVVQPAAVEDKKPEEEPQPEQPDTAEAQLKQAQEFIVKALEPVIAPLQAEILALKNELTAYKQQPQGDPLTPAASLVAKSITQQTGDHVVSGQLKGGDRGPKENLDKEGPPVQSVTGITFLDNLIALNQHRPTQQQQ